MIGMEEPGNAGAGLDFLSEHDSVPVKVLRRKTQVNDQDGKEDKKTGAAH